MITLCQHIEQYKREVKVVNTNIILQVGCSIARVHGLVEVMTDELVEFEQSSASIRYCSQFRIK